MPQQATRWRPQIQLGRAQFGRGRTKTTQCQAMQQPPQPKMSDSTAPSSRWEIHVPHCERPLKLLTLPDPILHLILDHVYPSLDYEEASLVKFRDWKFHQLIKRARTPNLDFLSIPYKKVDDFFIGSKKFFVAAATTYVRNQYLHFCDGWIEDTGIVRAFAPQLRIYSSEIESVAHWPELRSLLVSVGEDAFAPLIEGGELPWKDMIPQEQLVRLPIYQSILPQIENLRHVQFFPAAIPHALAEDEKLRWEQNVAALADLVQERLNRAWDYKKTPDPEVLNGYKNVDVWGFFGTQKRVLPDDSLYYGSQVLWERSCRPDEKREHRADSGAAGLEHQQSIPPAPSRPPPPVPGLHQNGYKTIDYEQSWRVLARHQSYPNIPSVFPNFSDVERSTHIFNSTYGRKTSRTPSLVAPMIAPYAPPRAPPRARRGSFSYPAADNMGSSRNRRRGSTISKLSQSDGETPEVQNDIRRLQAASRLYRPYLNSWADDDVQVGDHNRGREPEGEDTGRWFSGLLRERGVGTKKKKGGIGGWRFAKDVKEIVELVWEVGAAEGRFQW